MSHCHSQSPQPQRGTLYSCFFYLCITQGDRVKVHLPSSSGPRVKSTSSSCNSSRDTVCHAAMPLLTHSCVIWYDKNTYYELTKWILEYKHNEIMSISDVAWIQVYSFIAALVYTDVETVWISVQILNNWKRYGSFTSLRRLKWIHTLLLKPFTGGTCVSPFCTLWLSTAVLFAGIIVKEPQLCVGVC